jgi:hypothetical protein
MLPNVGEKAKNGKVFRQLADELQQLPRNDWTEWEWDWLGEMARKGADYRFSEREREKLAQIYSYSRLCSEHDGLTVNDMIRVCYRYHADYGEDDSNFISDLYKSQVTFVCIRQLRRLIRLYEDAGELISAE